MVIETKKLLDRAKIAKFELAREGVEDELNFVLRRSKCEDIVNVDSKNNVHFVLNIDEYGFICDRLFEADVDESLLEIVGP